MPTLVATIVRGNTKMHSTGNTMYGLLAEFDSVNALKAAADKVREAGFKQVDAYTPFPVEDLHHHLGMPSTKLPMLVLGAGFTGFLAGLGLQTWTTVIDYPINIGGRPLLSLPSFIPISFETTVLFAALTAAFGMLALNGFPRPYHPVFNVERFKAASTDGLFICIEASDPKFKQSETSDFLKRIGAKAVFEVPA